MSTSLYACIPFLYPISTSHLLLTTRRLTWKPMNTSIEQMEFRVFHNIFCSTFKIQKEAFAFDEYVAKVFQRSVLELIEIRLLDWFYVTCLLLLNLARVKLHLNLNSCSTNHDLACDNKRTVRLFTLAGSHRWHLASFVYLLLFVATVPFKLIVLYCMETLAKRSRCAIVLV